MNYDPNYYQELIDNVTLNALLYCYLECAEQKGFTPPQKRNLIITRYLKSLVKNAAYKSIKKEIKSLVYIGKRGESIEAKLWQMRSLYYNHGLDTDKLYALLYFIEEQLGIRSVLFTQDIEHKKELLYLFESHIDEGFDNDGKQIAPISLYIHSSKWKLIPELVKKQGRFTSELVSSHGDKAEILVYPSD